MGSIIKSEGKLYYKNWLLWSAAMVLGLAVLGMILHAFIVNFLPDDDMTVTYMGTFLATVGAICAGIMLGTNSYYRFKLLVGMGQKRKNVVLCNNIYILAFSVFNYLLSMVVLFAESNLYKIWFKDLPLDEEFLWAFKNFPLYSWLIIILFSLYFRVLVVFSEKYGVKVYFIGYISIVLIILGIDKLSEMEKYSHIFNSIIQILSNVPGFIWIVIGSVVCAVLVALHDIILNKMNV